MSAAITVVGSLNMDFVARVPRLPAPGETVIGSDFRMIPGGKGANQACAVGRLAGPGLAVRMVGCVGHDPFAAHLKASLSAAGVDIDGIRSTRAAATGIAMIWVGGNGQNSIMVAPGANHELRPRDVERMRSAFRDTRYALFQLETPLETVADAMRLARECGAETILDPAPAQPLDRALLELVSILTPNESEASLLLGREASLIDVDDSAEVAAALLEMGPRAVVLKLGAAGCFYMDCGGSTFCPAFPVEAVDTTAAGDTFNAAFAVALAEGRAMAAALRFANAAAGLSVTRHGAQSSAPAREEVERLAAL